MAKKKGSKREYYWLQCCECGELNYRTSVPNTVGTKLRLKKFCRRERLHREHKVKRK